MATRMRWRVAAGALVLVACKSEGPGAPPRKNGCIDTGCAPVTTAAPPSSSPDGGRANGATTTASWEMADEDALDLLDSDGGAPRLALTPGIY